MKSIDPALKYMENFYSGENLERLYEILASDLNFQGPLFTFNNSNEYIQSLIDDPALDCEYKIINTFESGNSVNLIYEFYKNNTTTLMSQLFEIEKRKIRKIILIFDKSNFF